MSLRFVPFDITFQFTLPRGERQRLLIGYFTSERFNSRSREGSDGDKVIASACLEVVSIHAPARGATLQASGAYPQFYVSIHAPARGATMVTLPTQTAEASFNSRSREGSDATATLDGVAERVSIHAPARGATLQEISRTTGRSMFQFTLPRGERLLVLKGFVIVPGFQFTLPRGERRIWSPPPRLPPRCFNSRSREGSDLYFFCSVTQLISFQFTLPRGERRSSGRYTHSTSTVSIHAPARGATSACMG